MWPLHPLLPNCRHKQYPRHCSCRLPLSLFPVLNCLAIWQSQQYRLKWWQNPMCTSKIISIDNILLGVAEHLIPASSKWKQLWLEVWGQSMSRASFPIHPTSSIWMAPVPRVNSKKLNISTPIIINSLYRCYVRTQIIVCTNHVAITYSVNSSTT
jgi:hypothetical protein